ncbi:MAG: S8 family peptidase [Candidatus Cloacimonetes bacterium]|nr:S8 family peptidase [Candidatus Cloacimonadota bacterium]
MKPLSFFLLLLVPILVCGLDFVPNQIIIKTTQPMEVQQRSMGIAAMDAALQSWEVVSLKPVFPGSDNRYFLATCARDIDWDAATNLRDSAIELVQPNYLNRFSMVPNDPDFYLQQNYLEDINMPQAWNYTTGNESIIIAVIDSGIHFDHPDLQSAVFQNPGEIPDDGLDNDANGYVDDWRGWDFVDAPELADIASGDFLIRDNDATDELNHGTHVCGIIGADTNNNLGVSGINWQAKILMLRAGFKTTNGQGFLQDDDAAAALIYAADMGANVINLSWGDTNYSPIIADACNYAYLHGCIIVASAGNEGATAAHVVTYPARLSTTIAVGAVDNANSLSSFSSYGPQIDVVAPGNQIYSCFSNLPDNLYTQQSGTSMSAPMVAGSIGLLLALDPTLSFDEVKARLATTAKDIGSVGFDNKFGNGLLDAWALLTETAQQSIAISTPADNSWLKENGPITGTVLASDFYRYSVMYTSASMPASTDWKSVEYPHVNTPTYHYDPVENGQLTYFDLPYLDGDYLLRLDASTTENQHFSLFRTIHIDRTPPEFIDSLSVAMRRYDGEFPTYALQTVFNEPVDLQITLSQGYTQTNLFSTITDSVQIILLPTNLAEGQWDVTFVATNQAGLSIQDAFPQPVTISHASVNITDFQQVPVDNQLVALRKTTDINGNGAPDFIGLEIADDQYTLGVFEPWADELLTLHTFPSEGLIWPHDIGSTDGQSLDFIGVESTNATIYETPSDGSWPSDSIWSYSGVYGAAFLDYNADGNDEVAIITNVDVSGSSQRAIVLNKRIGDFFLSEHTLLNNTPTVVKNEFVNKIASGDFDNDGNFDILTADTDGDVMLFEFSPVSNDFEMVWYTHLPVKNCYYLAAGDFRGTGNTEFCVGGYTQNTTDPDKAYSFFGFFAATGDDNTYVDTGYLSFANVQSANSIASADMDGDGDDEIIVAASPYIYVVDYQDNQFIPVWMGQSVATYQNVISAIAATATQPAHIITNQLQDGKIHGSIITPSAPFTGPNTPSNFVASITEEGMVHLSWSYPAGTADSFSIYRQFQGVTSLLDTTTEEECIINEPSMGDTISYRITATVTASTPAESRPTLWKTVVPWPAPEIETALMNSTNTIAVRCSQSLDASMQNPLHYTLDNDIGHPASALLTRMQTTILLSYNQPLPNIDAYLLTIDQLIGTNGANRPQQTVSIQYNEDTTPPEIVIATVTDDYTVDVYFSEPLEPVAAEDLSNYTLTPPNLDLDNRIESVHYIQGDQPVSRLTLHKKLQYSNQSYFLEVNNLEDWAGNCITQTGNKCRFGLTDITTLKHMIMYPNPLNRADDRVSGVNFINLPLHKTGIIRIYDVSGSLIFTQSFGPFASPAEFYCWDTRNKAQKRVSSGIYFYLMEMGADQRKGKIVIIR